MILMELEPLLAMAEPIVISGSIGSDVNEVSIGKKTYIKNGQFKYEWFAEYLDRNDLLNLAKALVFMADHMEVTE